MIGVGEFKRMAQESGAQVFEPGEGPWRVVNIGDDAPYYAVVCGDGKPRCGHCGRWGSDYDESWGASSVEAEAIAVCAALNAVSAQGEGKL